LLDTRPRTLEGPDLERLHDLADIVLREITTRSFGPPYGREVVTDHAIKA
jgi:hypothetical protein